MGSTKALLRHESGETFAETILRTCAACRLKSVIVRRPGDNALSKELQKLAEANLNFIEAFNPDPQSEMADSFRIGLAAVEYTRHTGAFIWPVDAPGVRVETLSLLAKLAICNPEKAVIPSYKGQKGHPAFMPIGAIAALLDMKPANNVLPLEHGLHTLLKEIKPEQLIVDVNDHAAAFNINRPEDLKRLTK